MRVDTNRETASCQYFASTLGQFLPNARDTFPEMVCGPSGHRNLTIVISVHAGQPLLLQKSHPNEQFCSCSTGSLSPPTFTDAAYSGKSYQFRFIARGIHLKAV